MIPGTVCLFRSLPGSPKTPAFPKRILSVLARCHRNRFSSASRCAAWSLPPYRPSNASTFISTNPNCSITAGDAAIGRAGCTAPASPGRSRSSPATGPRSPLSASRSPRRPRCGVRRPAPGRKARAARPAASPGRGLAGIVGILVGNMGSRSAAARRALTRGWTGGSPRPFGARCRTSPPAGS